MTPQELEQIARWLTDQGFTVLIDFENSRLILELGKE